MVIDSPNLAVGKSNDVLLYLRSPSLPTHHTAAMNLPFPAASSRLLLEFSIASPISAIGSAFLPLRLSSLASRHLEPPGSKALQVSGRLSYSLHLFSTDRQMHLPLIVFMPRYPTKSPYVR